MKTIRVGISSVGSGVGQAVVDSCRLSGMPLHLIGYGNDPFAFGAFDCHEQKILPSIYSAEYAEKLLEVCNKDSIDILIPGLDDELLLLAGHAETFRRAGTVVAVSGPGMLELCRDKALMWSKLSKISDVFVPSYTRPSLLKAVAAGLVQYPLIAKPLSGFASRGLFVIRDKSDLAKVTDAHVIQEIVVPAVSDTNHVRFLEALNNGEILQVSEISAQILVGRSGREIGRFLSCNKLNNGVPVEIIPLDAPEVWSEIDRLLPYFKEAGLVGPLNLQGRLTDEGPRFFEMNARFTGITGLRALSGFNEVAALIADLSGQEYADKILLRQNPRKIGVRQVADRVVDITADPTLTAAVESRNRFPGRGRGRRILVTGANGYLGRAVLESLLADHAVDSIVAMVRNPARFDSAHEPALPVGVETADVSGLLTGEFQMGGIDVICHLASGRPHYTATDIAESLKFTHTLVACAIRHQVPGFINASSQAVYGTARPPLWTEQLVPAPETSFAQSKWAAELMAASIPRLNPRSRATSLRLAQLIGPSPIRDTQRVVHKYIESAISGGVLQVNGGRQRLDFVDFRDAAELVGMLIIRPFSDWPDVLNVGSGEPVSVLNLANRVADL
ncbi:MAG TPA: NAD-dependent epimerase/dehydratase family protein, partial [Gammaproteobacteria bacterium]